MKHILPLLILLAALPASALFFSEEPTLSLEDDEAVLRWVTEEATPPARGSFGIEAIDDPFRSPRWRYSAREKGDSLRRRHELRRNLGWWEHRLLDAARLAASGGELIARVEAWDPASRALRYWETRMAYSKGGEQRDQVACIARGPFIDRVEPESAWLSWELDRPAAVRVDYGPAGSEEGWQTLLLPAKIRTEVPLEGLRPETEFRYRVSVEGAAFPARPWSFLTPPLPGDWPEDGRVRFAFLSDSRAGAGGGPEAVRGTNRLMIRRLLRRAELQGAQFVCFGGDLVDGYTDDPEEYRRELSSWLKASETVSPFLPIYEGMGNHEMLSDWLPEEGVEYSGMPPYRDKDGDESSESVFAEFVVNPLNGPAPPADGRGKETPPPFAENVYSFDWGAVHVAAMNNTYDVSSDPARLGGYREGSFPQEQLDWLDEDLAAARARGARELFVFAHEPAWPCGGHAGDAMYWNGEIPEVLANRDAYWDILMRHGVRATMYGDEHNFSALRVDSRVGDRYLTPVWNIISGGVGAPYYAQDFEVPWAEHVETYSVVQHVCIFDAGPGGVTLRAVDAQGRTIWASELD